MLLTHGHIDHTLNLSKWQQLTGAKILAPHKEREHIEGTYHYRGLSRVCGWMERSARALLSYQPPTINQWFEPGTVLPLWGGLEVIPLPGHTYGHVGFYSAKRKVLIAADLFSNFYYYPKPPPPWFNVDRQELRKSLLRALDLDTSGGILLNHCHPGTPREHRADLYRLASRMGLL